MDQKDIEHLKRILLKDFNYYLKAGGGMKGYLKRDYRIAKANSLNETLIKSMEQMYFDKFKTNINN